MKRIVVSPRLRDEEVAALEGEHLTEKNFHILMDGTEDFDCDAEDGSPLIRYRTKVIPAAIVRKAHPTFHMAAKGTDPSNRGTAAGNEYKGKRIRRDGTVSDTTSLTIWKHPELKTMGSAVIGFMDRYPRMPFCRQTAFNIRHGDLFAEAIPYMRRIGEVFAEALPRRYEAQMEFARRTHPDFIIPGTPFTTVTINRNFPTAAHYDAGDLKAGFGALSVIRRGEYTGGYLCIPKYGIALDAQTQAAIFLDVHQLHGNTPIIGKRGRYERLTTVLYYREDMFKCGSAQHELERAKKRREGEPMYD